LFKEKFGYTQDVEFIMCASADSDDVRSYQYEDSPGPDLVSPLFDLRHNAKSPWNSAIIDTLTQNLQGKCAEENWPTPRSDAYLREMIVDRYKRLRVTWKNAQPQLTDMGTLETPAETEARLLKQREQVLRETRQTTRRHSKYARRAMTLDHIIKLKTEENEDDLDAWKWLHKLIVGAYKSPLYCRS
ncbi:hypothetical protein BKA83DRAFT_4045117, partial [Pisolithus microcarpus]